MPVYTYIALNTNSNIVKGKIEADSLKEARESIRRLDLIPTKIEEQSGLSSSKTQQNNKNIFKQRKVAKIKALSMREKIDFISSLQVLSRTGISLVEALLFIQLNISSKKTQRLVADVRRMILSGSSFSEAIIKHPETFNRIFTGLIVAGEQTGELDLTLERIVHLLNKQDKIKSKIIAISIYPVFVVCLAIAVTIIMITFVFPKFKTLYDNMGNKLPWITQTFIDMGIFLNHYWYMLPIIFLTVGYAIWFLLNWSPSRQKFDQLLFKIPVIKTFIQFVGLANFVSVLKVCFDAGIPIIDGILLANMTINNYKIRDSFKDITSKIQQGQSLSNALRASGVIPGMIMCMIATGEETGQLSETLGQAESYIDTQIERVMDALNKMLEPLLLLFIGSIALVLALALYLPLFQTYANML